MARIVGAVACSHGPLLSVEPARWGLRAAADRCGGAHWFRGVSYGFDALNALRESAFAASVTPAAQQIAYAACQRELDLLANHVQALRPELVLLVGNDQREVFRDELTPAIALYTGETIDNIPFSAEQRAKLPPGVAEAEIGHCPPDGARYPGASASAVAVVGSLMDQGFDVCTSARLPSFAAAPGAPGRQHGIPHAFGFVYRRILADEPPPSIPVILNVGVPPNSLRTSRALALGRALAHAAQALPAGLRTVLVASGGLSHFVVDEELDRRVLAALARSDEDELRAIPESWFNGNTGEIKSWLVVAAALAHAGLRMTRSAYVPCYRTEAGTGSGMGFACWGEGAS